MKRWAVPDSSQYTTLVNAEWFEITEVGAAVFYDEGGQLCRAFAPGRWHGVYEYTDVLIGSTPPLPFGQAGFGHGI